MGTGHRDLQEGITRSSRGINDFVRLSIYAPDTEGAVRFDDADIGIDWGLGGRDPVLSEKDAAAQGFAALDSPFTWQGGAP